MLAHPSTGFPFPHSHFDLKSNIVAAGSPPPSYASSEEVWLSPNTTPSSAPFVAARWVPPSPPRNRPGPPTYNASVVHAGFGLEYSSYAHPPVDLDTTPSLRGRLDELDFQMEALRKERERIHAQLQTAVHRNRTPPIESLPTEVLASIFVIGATLSQETDSLTLPALMLVCSRWRDVVVRTPHLWSRISVQAHDSLAKTRRRLERSGSVPLDISVNFSPHFDQRDPSTEEVVRAMTLLQASIERWRSFHLTVSTPSHCRAALMSCRDPAPLLEALSIKVDQALVADHHAVISFPLFGGCTPRLKSCSISSFDFGWRSGIVQGLRILRLNGYWGAHTPTLSDLLFIVRGCSDLEELSLRNISDDHDIGGECGQAGMTVVSLPRLRKLDFSYSGSRLVTAVLSQISFPALEYLDLSFVGDITPTFEYLLHQARSTLPLRTLHIEGCSLVEQKFVWLMHYLSTVTTLELIEVEDISPNFLRELAVPPLSKTWLCPNLEHLSFRGCTSVDWMSLHNLVESRLPAHATSNPRPPFRLTTTQPDPAHLRPSAPSAMNLDIDLSHGLGPVSLSTQAEILAAQARLTRAKSAPPFTSASGLIKPRQLLTLDISRCPQISSDKDRLRWLEMYVPTVRFDAVPAAFFAPY